MFLGYFVKSRPFIVWAVTFSFYRLEHICLSPIWFTSRWLLPIALKMWISWDSLFTASAVARKPTSCSAKKPWKVNVPPCDPLCWQGVQCCSSSISGLDCIERNDFVKTRVAYCSCGLEVCLRFSMEGMEISCFIVQKCSRPRWVRNSYACVGTGAFSEVWVLLMLDFNLVSWPTPKSRKLLRREPVAL